MRDEKPKAHDLTTEEAVKHLFPKEAREAVRAEAQKQPKSGQSKGSTGKDST